MEIDRHTFYIAASYGMVVVAIIIELIAVRKRRASALQQAATISAVRPSPNTGRRLSQRDDSIASEAS